MFRLKRVIIRLRSDISFLAVLLLTVSCSGGCWSVWSGGWLYTDMNENLKTYIKKYY
jgi:hypothetical protein